MFATNPTSVATFRIPQQPHSHHHSHIHYHQYVLTSSRTQNAHKHRPNSSTDTAVLVSFAPSFGDVSIYAQPGEILIDVAERCGIDIPVGCCTGNCGVCEVEIRKFLDIDASFSSQGESLVVRACISHIPSREVATRIEVEELTDAVWGLDGYDT